jgi:hypothetical protein
MLLQELIINNKQFDEKGSFPKRLHLGTIPAEDPSGKQI